MTDREAAPLLAFGAARRILLKISGEALMGSGGFGLDPETLAQIAEEVRSVHASGVDVCMVIGGGNIFRGVAAASRGVERTTGDYMGMLATVMNALAMQSALESLGVAARVLSAIAMPPICEPYDRRRALEHIGERRVVIFTAGTGNPFFTTDTAAVLRALEMDCDLLLKGTKVDGVYSADPLLDPTARRYRTLSYDRVLAENLRVMDAAAIALSRDNGMPILVFCLYEKGAFLKTLQGKGAFTAITG